MHGDRLIKLLSQATREVVLAAPFVKDSIVERLLQVIPLEARSITIITRWIPSEIAAGVSDIEIFDRLALDSRVRLLLNTQLHAKYYRVDGKCLIGSANLTARALGWAVPSNIELLVEMDASDGDLQRLEKELLYYSISADASMRDAMIIAVDELRKMLPSLPNLGINEPGNPLVPRLWLPTCPSPEKLWNVYSNHESWRLVKSASDAAKTDLDYLMIPQKLPKELFELHVRTALSQNLMVKILDNRIQQGISDEEAAGLISGSIDPSKLLYPPLQMWTVLKNWLVFFDPKQYRRESQGEVLRKGRTY